MRLGGTNEGPCEDPEFDRPLDLAALRADDALLDALASGRALSGDLPATAQESDSELIAMLAAWVAEVRPEEFAPTPPLKAVTATAAPVLARPTPSRQRPAVPRRRRWSTLPPLVRRMSAAAVLAVLASSGLAFGATHAAPAGTAVEVSTVAYAQRSVALAADVAGELSTARVALQQGRRADAARMLDTVPAQLGAVRPADGRDDLAREHERLRKVLAASGPPAAAQLVLDGMRRDVEPSSFLATLPDDNDVLDPPPATPDRKTPPKTDPAKPDPADLALAAPGPAWTAGSAPSTQQSKPPSPTTGSVVSEPPSSDPQSAGALPPPDSVLAEGASGASSATSTDETASGQTSTGQTSSGQTSTGAPTTTSSTPTTTSSETSATEPPGGNNPAGENPAGGSQSGGGDKAGATTTTKPRPTRTSPTKAQPPPDTKPAADPPAKAEPPDPQAPAGASAAEPKPAKATKKPARAKPVPPQSADFIGPVTDRPAGSVPPTTTPVPRTTKLSSADKPAGGTPVDGGAEPTGDN